MPAGSGGWGGSEEIVRIDGYIVREYCDKLQIRPYDFDDSGNFSVSKNVTFTSDPGLDVHSRIANDLYKKYLQLKAKGEIT